MLASTKCVLKAGAAIMVDTKVSKVSESKRRLLNMSRSNSVKIGLDLQWCTKLLLTSLVHEVIRVREGSPESQGKGW